MDIRKIKKLIELMIESDLEAIEVKEGDQSIALTRRSALAYTDAQSHVTQAPAPVAATTIAEVTTAAARHETSPMVGVYYAAPNPGEPAFIKVGQKIKAGDTIGIVEAMKIMNPIQATQDGTIAEILVNNSDVIQYGQPLIRLKD